MLIELSTSQELRLLELVGTRAAAEAADDCEPSGYELVVVVCGPYGAHVSVRLGDDVHDLGDVQITLSDDRS